MKQGKSVEAALLGAVFMLIALPAVADAGEEVFRLNSALETYQKEYKSASTHKAFAQSPDGAWAWRSGRTSIQFAREDALRGCNSHLKEGEAPCVVVNVDGAWVNK